MEIEKDKTIPFLDTSVIRASDVLFTTIVYRKSIHTNQCLALDLYHPQSVERGIVKCLYSQSPQNETVSYLRGKETLVICVSFETLS